jgi:N-acetyl-beta-hexosaminidase
MDRIHYYAMSKPEYMILPRMLALSEVLWSPKEQRNWKSFNDRLKPHLVGFEQSGLHYSKGNFKVDIKPMIENGKLQLPLKQKIRMHQFIILLMVVCLAQGV